MPIVGGLDIHRKQITFDYLETATGVVQRGQVRPADRLHLRAPRMIAVEFARFLGLPLSRRSNVTDVLEAVCGVALDARTTLVCVDPQCQPRHPARRRGLRHPEVLR